MSFQQSFTLLIFQACDPSEHANGQTTKSGSRSQSRATRSQTFGPLSSSSSSTHQTQTPGLPPHSPQVQAQSQASDGGVPPGLASTLEHIIGQLDILTQVSRRFVNLSWKAASTVLRLCGPLTLFRTKASSWSTCRPDMITEHKHRTPSIMLLLRKTGTLSLHCCTECGKTQILITQIYLWQQRRYYCFYNLIWTVCTSSEVPFLVNQITNPKNCLKNTEHAKQKNRSLNKKRKEQQPVKIWRSASCQFIYVYALCIC